MRELKYIQSIEFFKKAKELLVQAISMIDEQEVLEEAIKKAKESLNQGTTAEDIINRRDYRSLVLSYNKLEEDIEQLLKEASDNITKGNGLLGQNKFLHY